MQSRGSSQHSQHRGVHGKAKTQDPAKWSADAACGLARHAGLQCMPSDDARLCIRIQLLHAPLAYPPIVLGGE